MSFLFILTSFSTFAGRDGNGGNEIALRFTQVAKDGLKYLSMPGKNKYDLDLESLESAIRSTKVYTVTYKLCSLIDDKECEQESGFVAKNYPDTNEIYINEKRWKSLSANEKHRLVIHEYLGMIGVEEANYAISSSVIVALDASYGNKYSCQLSLLDTSYPAKVLGTAGFIISNGNASAKMKSFPIKGSKDDVVFRVVTARDYLRGRIEIAKVNRKNKFFTDVKEIKSTVFDNVTFFSEEPIGVKVFKSKKYHLQVACSHI